MVKVLTIEFVTSEIVNIRNILDLLKLIPEGSRVDFMVKVLTREFVTSKIEDTSDLLILVEVIPKDSRVDFMKTFERDFLQSKIENPWDLIILVGVISEDSLVDFLVKKSEEGIVSLREKLDTITELVLLLECFKEEDKQIFLLEKLGMDFVRSKIEYVGDIVDLIQSITLSSGPLHAEKILNLLGMDFVKSKLENVDDDDIDIPELTASSPEKKIDVFLPFLRQSSTEVSQITSPPPRESSISNSGIVIGPMFFRASSTQSSELVPLPHHSHYQ